MIDEIFDRNYQAGRSQMNAAMAGAVRRLGNAIDNAFNVLHRVEYDAPWLARRRRTRRV
jgi:hypothetical protein